MSNAQEYIKQDIQKYNFKKYSFIVPAYVVNSWDMRSANKVISGMEWTENGGLRIEQEK